MTNERKIKGYNLNELGEKNFHAIKSICNSNELTTEKTPEGYWCSSESPYFVKLRDAGVLDIWFTPVFEEQYKEGEWLFCKGHHCGSWIVKKGCNFVVDSLGNIDEERDATYEACDISLANEEQLLSHLSAALEKKGYVKGAKVRCLYVKRHALLTGGFMISMDNMKMYGYTVYGGNIAIFDLNTLEFAEIIVQPKEEKGYEGKIQVTRTYSEVKVPQQEFENSEKVKSSNVQSIYSMKLHEVIALTPTSISGAGYSYFTIMRVAGGWIYQIWDESKQDLVRETFVPLNNEFM